MPTVSQTIELPRTYPSDVSELERDFLVAGRAHEGQRYEGRPGEFIVRHCGRTAVMAAMLGLGTGPFLSLMLLHDSAEDNTRDGQVLPVEENQERLLEIGVDPAVVHSVDLFSHRPGQNYGGAYIPRIIQSGDWKAHYGKTIDAGVHSVSLARNGFVPDQARTAEQIAEKDATLRTLAATLPPLPDNAIALPSDGSAAELIRLLRHETDQLGVDKDVLLIPSDPRRDPLVTMAKHAMISQVNIARTRLALPPLDPDFDERARFAELVALAA